jgi:hypothetical protein
VSAYLPDVTLAQAILVVGLAACFVAWGWTRD